MNIKMHGISFKRFPEMIYLNECSACAFSDRLVHESLSNRYRTHEKVDLKYAIVHHSMQADRQRDVLARNKL